MKASAKIILNSIDRVKQNLTLANFLYDRNESVIERVAKGRRRITWATSGTRPELSDAASSNIGEYLTFVRGRHYQFMLRDGSLIQISYDLSANDDVFQSRLVWYPCPVSFDPEELEFASIDELVETAPLDVLGCRAPLRFDYAPNQIADNHSCTHLHLGMEDLRLPVQRPFEPSRFIRLIMRTAYPQLWRETTFFRDVEDWGAQDRLDQDDRAYGALSWQVIVGEPQPA
jgi:hypothetical protein